MHLILRLKGDIGIFDRLHEKKIGNEALNNYPSNVPSNAELKELNSKLGGNDGALLEIIDHS